ncbi:MAG: hypothetical protein WEE89_06330 [Gemmatimonadota bacterium]
MNAKMLELRVAFEVAGFRGRENGSLERERRLHRTQDSDIIASAQSRSGNTEAPQPSLSYDRAARRRTPRPAGGEPVLRIPLTARSKRIVTFLRDKPTVKLNLPIEHQGVTAGALLDLLPAAESSATITESSAAAAV